MKPYNVTYLFAVIAITSIFVSCKSGGEFTGREYMPDMAHSIAYEANQSTYYSFNQWSTKDEYNEYVQPRNPVEGTIAFGRSKENVRSNSPLTYPRYAFQNTEEERAKAQEMITSNPLRPTSEADLENVLSKGQELYEIFCGSCHGKAGDGNGKLYELGVYPAAPANFLSDQFLTSTDGRFYHAIMHGKNVMLSHADKLNHDERWMVIHYIRSLQAAKSGTEYNLDAASGNKPKVEETEKENEEKKEDK